MCVCVCVYRDNEDVNRTVVFSCKVKNGTLLRYENYLFEWCTNCILLTYNYTSLFSVSLQLLNKIRLFLVTLIYIYNNISELSNNKNERNFDISTTLKRSTAFLILKIGGLVFFLHVIIIGGGDERM